MPVPPEELPLGDGSRLRRLTADDWPLEQALSHVADVPRWTYVPPRLTAARARDRVRSALERGAQGAAARYVIEQDGWPVGVAGLAALDAEEPAGYYLLLPEGRGRGHATRAVRALAAWATVAGYRRVRLLTRLGNAPSEAVARRAGFVDAGRARDEHDGAALRVWLWPPPAG